MGTPWGRADSRDLLAVRESVAMGSAIFARRICSPGKSHLNAREDRPCLLLHGVFVSMWDVLITSRY